MRIIETFGELSKVEKYKLTANSVSRKGFKDIVDIPVVIIKGLSYVDEKTKDDGTVSEKELSSFIVKTKEGETFVVGGDSKTVYDSWIEITENFEDDAYGENGMFVKVVAQKSKNDRTFLHLELV